MTDMLLRWICGDAASAAEVARLTGQLLGVPGSLLLSQQQVAAALKQQLQQQQDLTDQAHQVIGKLFVCWCV
jgi:hypothetical protein